MSISNFWELEILDATFKNLAVPSIATIYISLHSADPGETGASEIAAGGNTYARQTAAFDTAAAGATANSALIEWLDMPGLTVTHVGVWDALTTGNFIWGGVLDSSQVVAAGNTFQIAAGDLDVTLD